MARYRRISGMIFKTQSDPNDVGQENVGLALAFGASGAATTKEIGRLTRSGGSF